MESKIVILLCLGQIGLVGLVFFLFSRLNGLKTTIKDTKVEWLETQKAFALEKIKMETDVASIRGTVESINTTHYEELLKKNATNALRN